MFRFQAATLRQPLFRALGRFAESWRSPVAPLDDLPPSLGHRLAVFPLMFIPWLILYECVVYRGPLPHAFQTYLPGEFHWPIYQWTELLYVSPYLLVSLVPFFANRNSELRQFLLSGLLATVIVFTIFLTVPALATPRPFIPHGLLGRMMIEDRLLDRNNGTAAFPSFHVFWSFLGAAIYARRFPRAATVWWLWATLVSASCIFTGMHSLLDVLAGFGVFLLTYHYRPIGRWVQGRLVSLHMFDPIDA